MLVWSMSGTRHRRRMDHAMNDATLDHFRQLAASMQTAPTDWQWIGPHMSQRMFGITQARAEAYAARHGGEAKRMDTASDN